MKIICTKSEQENISRIFCDVCPFTMVCPCEKCLNCIEENIDWEITDKGE